MSGLRAECEDVFRDALNTTPEEFDTLLDALRPVPDHLIVEHGTGLDLAAGSFPSRGRDGLRDVLVSAFRHGAGRCRLEGVSIEARFHRRGRAGQLPGRVTSRGDIALEEIPVDASDLRLRRI
jgi:hypothetical protein